MTTNQVADQLGCDWHIAKRYLDELEEAGQIIRWTQSGYHFHSTTAGEFRNESEVENNGE